MRKAGGIVFAIIIIAIGVFLLVLTGNAARRCTEPVEGTVVGYVEQSDEDGTSYFPKIQYMFDRKQYTEMAPTGSGKKQYAEGTELVILVNPDNPYDFLIKGDHVFRTVGWVTLLLGLLVLFGEVLNFVGFGGKTYYTGNGQMSGLFVDIFAFFYALIKGRQFGDSKGYDDSATANGWDNSDFSYSTDAAGSGQDYAPSVNENGEQNFDDYN